MNVKDKWESYLREVIPANAPPLQLQESRRAFYAGARALFTLVMVGFDAGEEPTQADLDRISAIDEELHAFCEDVKAGRDAFADESDPPDSDYRVPVRGDVKAILKDMGRIMDKALPSGWGFGLLLFEFGEGGTMTWISNAQRADMLKVMQEFLQKQAS